MNANSMTVLYMHTWKIRGRYAQHFTRCIQLLRQLWRGRACCALHAYASCDGKSGVGKGDSRLIESH
jgi:hypothetical protein